MVSPSGSGSSSGGAGGLGSPMSPTQRDIETSAWTEINKAALNIVHDSIDISFTQMGGQNQTNYLSSNTGYRAREDQPLLGHTLENVRVLQSEYPMTEAAWSSTYDELVNQLPADLKARYQEEEQKPLNEREPSFAAAANVLQLGAKILTSIAIHAHSADPESLEATRTELNKIASFVALKQSIANTLNAANKAEEYLQDQGANLPNHDEYKDILTQIKGFAETLDGVDLGTLTNTGEKSP